MSAVVAAGLAAASALTAVAGARRVRWERHHGVRGRGAVAVRWAAGRRLGAALDRAGVRIGPDAFVASVAGACVLAGLAGAVVTGSPVIVFAGAAGVVVAASSLVTSAERRYVGRVTHQLPGVAQLLGTAVGAGLSLHQAIVRAARDAPDPVASELGHMARQLDLGERVDVALEQFAERIPDAAVRLMVTAIGVHRVVGGPLASTLMELADRLEERDALVREVRGATAQAKLSAWLVAGLPAVGGVMVEIASPGTLAAMLGRGPGLVLLVVAAALQALGVIVIRRMTGRLGASA